MDAEEFIRRFIAHILPEGFVRVRYYGIFGGSGRQEKLAKARGVIGGLKEKAAGSKEIETDGYAPKCPECGAGEMIVVEYIREPVSMVWILMLVMSVKYYDSS